MGKRMMTLEMLKNVMELSNRGICYREISEKTGVSHRAVANYVRTVNRHFAGLPPLVGDHCNETILTQYYEKNEGNETAMEKGVKMTAREVERIATLKGAGKSDTEIAAELNRAVNTVTLYSRAIKQAINGTFVHQSDSGVRAELILPYMRKDGRIQKTEQILNDAAVKNANRSEIKMNADGVYTIDPENALLIANELEIKTPVDIIARLMKVDIPSVSKIKTYTDLLKSKENDKAIIWKNSGALLEETCVALEKQYGFFPKERTEQDIEADFRKNVLQTQELICDLLDSIDTLLRKVCKAFEKPEEVQVSK